MAQVRAAELAETAERLRQQDAIFRVELANREMLDNNLARAQDLLDGCPPDLRGWGWRYVMKLGHRDRMTLFGHHESVQGAAFSIGRGAGWRPARAPRSASAVSAKRQSSGSGISRRATRGWR